MLGSTVSYRIAIHPIVSHRIVSYRIVSYRKKKVRYDTIRSSITKDSDKNDPYLDVVISVFNDFCTVEKLRISVFQRRTNH